MEADRNRIGFQSIGDVSEKTGVKPHILRYWEKEFPFLQPLKNKAGHRMYSPRDVAIIKDIKNLLYTKGYSISGAKKVLWGALLGKTDPNISSFIEEVKTDLRELLRIIEENLKKDKR